MEETLIWLPDIPRIFTAVAEWLACILCICELKRKVNGGKLAFVSAAFLLIQSTFLIMTEGMQGALWILCMAMAVAIMYGFILLCCDVSMITAGCYCARAFIIAEFAAALEWQTYCYFLVDYQWNSNVFKIVWLILVYVLVYGIIYAFYKKASGKGNFCQSTGKELLTYISITISVFCMSNLGFVNPNTPFGGRHSGEIFNVRTLVDLGGVAVLYAFYVQKIEIDVRNELKNMQNILQNQYLQYQQSKEFIELINYKYHDLKHYIIALRTEENKERNSYFKKIEEEIGSFEAQSHTGNKVLDILLTAKSLQCRGKEIALTSVVNGELFGFMEDMDICSIFGNALDNAIECEEKIQDKEKRLIHVSVYSRKNFLIIRFENYYEGAIRLDEGIPVTTKADKDFHGYGMKSLRYTVQKYGGEIDIDVKDNWFNLKLLIPIQ